MITVDKKRDIKALIVAILIPLVAGFIVSKAVPGMKEMYLSFELPSFAPPGWLFAPVWAVLYMLMGLAYYRISMVGKVGFNIRLQKFFYFFQLVLNLLWTPLFFYFGMKGLALIEIVLLDVVLLITIALFNNRDKLSARLLIPYLLWVLYATALNFSIWLNN